MLLILVIGGLAISLPSLVVLEARNPKQQYIEMGSWIKHNTPVESSVAMVEIGTIGWHSKREIVDILGLVNPYNAEHITKREFMSWVTHYQSDYIIRHDPIWPHEQSIPPLEREGFYISVGAVKIPGLVLLKLVAPHEKELVREFAELTIQESHGSR